MSYTCAVHGRTLAVSLWGSARVAFLDTATRRPLGVTPVAQHPCALAFDAAGQRLFVASANDNVVSVIDTGSLQVEEVLSTALAPDLPPGCTPNALYHDPHRDRLYAASADTNDLAVFDVATRGRTRALGFLPAGWYPTGVVGSRDMLLVLDGKGFGSAPNPAALATMSFLQGGAQLLAPPDDRDLARATAAVYRNSRAGGKPPAAGYPLIGDGARGTPIKHVFYVLKENKTYDSVFGDLDVGNGQRDCCLFGEAITPNQHALAREFVLLDNFYVDAEVSADGHNWSLGAYATDWVEKSWPTHYGGRGGSYDDEWLGDGIEKPKSGYLWDLCRRHGVTFRNYGEYVRNPVRGGEPVRALSASLQDVTCASYRGWDLRSRDLDRFLAWEREFTAYEQHGGLPQLSLIYLPDDHGAGTASGYRTMSAMVAENDLALGKLVERISHSRFWPESAMFVLEDDAQGGADHVDVHRSIAFVISPFARRHAIDSTPYSTTSVLRTIELILGLPPMSQFDASAEPMQACFQGQPDQRAFAARAARVPLGELNPEQSAFQDECDRMDFTLPDRAPDRRYAEIIWATMASPRSPMPPPRRAAFVQVLGGEADADD
ncbi:MAG: alkaline phosphatase family protein [Planctomycetota bacterium]